VTENKMWSTRTREQNTANTTARRERDYPDKRLEQPEDKKKRDVNGGQRHAGERLQRASSRQHKLANPQPTVSSERKRVRSGCACSKNKEQRAKNTKQTLRKHNEF